VLKAFTGSFFGADAITIKGLFDGFTASPVQLTFWHSLFMLATMLVVFAASIPLGESRALFNAVPVCAADVVGGLCNDL